MSILIITLADMSRNHAFIQEVMAGGGPIHMVTKRLQDPHLETVGWENFWV